MQKTEEVELDGLVFSITQLPAGRAWDLMIRLGAVVGPVLAKAGGAASSLELGRDGSFDLSKMNVSELGNAVELFFSKLSVAEAKSIRDALLATVKCNGADVSKTFDLLFQGRMMVLLKLLGQCVRVNYSDFSEGLGELARRIPTPRPFPSAEPNISAGLSGDSSSDRDESLPLRRSSAGR